MTFDKTDLIKNTEKIKRAGEKAHVDSSLPEIAECITVLNNKLTSMESVQRGIDHQIISGKIENDKIDRLTNMASIIFSNLLEGFYCLKSSVQYYIAELDIDIKFGDFQATGKGTGAEEEEEGAVWRVELFDFTYSNTPKTEDIITLS